MRWLRNFVQHVLSPLHVYCRLCDCGFHPGKASIWALNYERYYRKVFGNGR